MKPLNEVMQEIEEYLKDKEYSEKINFEYTINMLKTYYDSLHFKCRMLELELQSTKKLLIIGKSLNHEHKEINQQA